MRFQGCERLDQDMRVRVSRCDDSTNSRVNRGWVNRCVRLDQDMRVRVSRCDDSTNSRVNRCDGCTNS